MTLLRIVSGGQTGIDRGALDAALDAGFCCGGWCPEGRLAEDGPIDARYPLVELPGGSYPDRTRRNVLDSDATVIIHFGAVDGGTALTARECARLDKPCRLIDATATTAPDAAGTILEFIAANGVKTLNVAGPRASKVAGARDYAYQSMTLVLKKDFR